MIFCKKAGQFSKYDINLMSKFVYFTIISFGIFWIENKITENHGN
jgi:hypothetical protein